MFLLYFIIFLVCLKIYNVLTLGKCSSTTKLNGKVALVTGASKGIGYYTALNLAKRGAKVIITSTNLEDLKKIQKQMILESGNKDIIAKQLDYLSLQAVRTFATDILDTESRLDILVNNAGTSLIHGEKYTKDGLVPLLQVNYFGQFLLTHLLLGLLKSSAPSRIVNVSSVLSNIPFWFDSNNINSSVVAEGFTPVKYFNSKICMAHSTIEMAKRLKGSAVTVNCLHPGIVYTKIYYKMLWTRVLALLARFFVFKTAEEGAETSIHLATCEKVEGVTGKYFRDCRPSWIWANLGAESRKRVWEQSVKLTGLKPEEMII